MTDRELLELAAKAAGYTLKWGEVFIVGDDEVDCTDIAYVVSGQPDEADWHWAPLTDDGDALRLAVKLHMFDAGLFMALRLEETRKDPSKNDYEITRRAIVRASAEIGKGMK